MTRSNGFPTWAAVLVTVLFLVALGALLGWLHAELLEWGLARRGR